MFCRLIRTQFPPLPDHPFAFLLPPAGCRDGFFDDRWVIQSKKCGRVLHQPWNCSLNAKLLQCFLERKHCGRSWPDPAGCKRYERVGEIKIHVWGQSGKFSSSCRLPSSLKIVFLTKQHSLNATCENQKAETASSCSASESAHVVLVPFSI